MMIEEACEDSLKSIFLQVKRLPRKFTSSGQTDVKTNAILLFISPQYLGVLYLKVKQTKTNNYIVATLSKYSSLCYKNRNAKFQIYMSILTFLYHREEQTVTNRQTGHNYIKVLLLKRIYEVSLLNKKPLIKSVLSLFSSMML